LTRWPTEATEAAAPAADVARFTRIHTGFDGQTRGNHLPQFGLDDLPLFVTGSDLGLDRCQGTGTTSGTAGTESWAAGSEFRKLRLWKLEVLALHFRPLGLLFGGERGQDVGLGAKTFLEVLDFRLLLLREV
jgi:hypothetical protein